MDKDETQKLKTELADTYDQLTKRIKEVKALRKRGKELEAYRAAFKDLSHAVWEVIIECDGALDNLKERYYEAWECINTAHLLPTKAEERELRLQMELAEEVEVSGKAQENLKTLTAERDRLVEALIKYGRHKALCGKGWLRRRRRWRRECTCGFEAALKEGE